MRRSSCVGSRSEGNYCSTWSRWISEAEESTENNSITKEEEGVYDGSLVGDSSDEVDEILRNENEQKKVLRIQQNFRKTNFFLKKSKICKI